MTQPSTEDFSEKMRQTITQLRKTDIKDAVSPDVPIQHYLCPKKPKIL